MNSRSSADHTDELFRLGTEIFEREVRPVLRLEDEGKFVAIDVDSGCYEIDNDDYTATERLLDHHPQARIWLARAGERAAYRVGGRSAALEDAE
jgi:hypothetical protein